MTIQFNCPACQKVYNVADNLAGKTSRCGCGNTFTIPAAQPVAPKQVAPQQVPQQVTPQQVPQPVAPQQPAAPQNPLGMPQGQDPFAGGVPAAQSPLAAGGMPPAQNPLGGAADPLGMPAGQPMGQPMAPAGQPAWANQGAQGKSKGSGGSKKKLIIIISVAVLLIGGGIAAFFIFTGDDDSSTDGAGSGAPTAGEGGAGGGMPGMGGGGGMPGMGGGGGMPGMGGGMPGMGGGMGGMGGMGGEMQDPSAGGGAGGAGANGGGAGANGGAPNAGGNSGGTPGASPAGNPVGNPGAGASTNPMNPGGAFGQPSGQPTVPVNNQNNTNPAGVAAGNSSGDFISLLGNQNPLTQLMVFNPSTMKPDQIDFSQTGTNSLNVSGVTDAFQGALVLNVQAIMASPFFEQMKQESGELQQGLLMAEQFSQQLGIGFDSIESIFAVQQRVSADVIASGSQPKFAVVVDFKQGSNLTALSQLLIQGMTSSGIPLQQGTPVGQNARLHRTGDYTKGPGVLFVGTTRIAAGDNESLTLIANGGAPGTLAKRMQAVDSSKAASVIIQPGLVDPSVIQNAAALDPQLAQMGPALQAISLLRGLTLTLGLSQSPSLDLRIETNNEKSAQQLFALALNGKNTLGQLLSVQALAGNAQNTGVPQETLNASLKLLQSMKVGYQQNNVGLQVAVSTEMLAMLQDATGAARTKARDITSQNNLKQIGLALMTYENTYKQYPNGESPNVQYDDNGKPLLSWRVHILPFIEQDVLYKQFKLDEPWDSPHNMALADQMPITYTHPSFPELGGRTVYLATVAEEGNMKSAFGNWLTRRRDITDGETQTVMLAEVAPAKAQIWTQPDDVEINLSDVPSSLGFGQGDTINLLLCDGRIAEVPSDLMPATWRSLILRNDGQPITEKIAQ